MSAYILPLSRLLQSPSTLTAVAARKPRLARSESQKKRSAAKAAETRARNKAAKAVQNGQGSGAAIAVQPSEASAVNSTPPPIPQVRPESTLLRSVDNCFGAYITSS